MKIIFFGSDNFAALHLKALLGAKHEVLCCVTGPDKPQGRGMKIVAAPLKEMALANKLPYLQPVTLKDKTIVDDLRSYGADIFVVVAYGRLLTQEILDIPNMLCMNVHGALLPKYRGAAPVHWAILNGDKETGITIQKMFLALDAGDIIAQEIMTIGDDENAGQLRQRMAQAGSELLVDVLARHPLGQFPLTPQDETLVTYAPKLTKDMGKIDWKRSAKAIHDQIRGLQPWPGAYTFYKGKMLKITKAQMTAEDNGKHAAGEVTQINKNGFYVACGSRGLLIKEVQPEASKVMPADSFVAGYKVVTGTTFT